ncbi:MAG: hypothetical protein KDF65_07595 [Anaerolineae bacterium]|nr:hypothetical protein [Anaerolineae bacterium]
MARISQLPAWLQTNAWREIFARIFQDVETKLNVSPDWLINPATRRRLKLDMLYPALGVAVRFEGLQGKNQRRRLSLEEETQQHTRDNARVEMCEAHGIALIAVDTHQPEAKTTFQEIDRQLSRAGQRLETAEQRETIHRARATAASISRRVNNLADLKLYADLWEDRQYQIPVATTPAVAPNSKAPLFSAGMSVEHTAFGPGVVIEVTPSENDTLVTVDFITAGQKTLIASLVSDKLRPT